MRSPRGGHATKLIKRVSRHNQRRSWRINCKRNCSWSKRWRYTLSFRLTSPFQLRTLAAHPHPIYTVSLRMANAGGNYATDVRFQLGRVRQITAHFLNGKCPNVGLSDRSGFGTPDRSAVRKDGLFDGKVEIPDSLLSSPPKDPAKSLIVLIQWMNSDQTSGAGCFNPTTMETGGDVLLNGLPAYLVVPPAGQRSGNSPPN